MCDRRRANLAELIAGVDDAGRGPIIGPLVIAGVLMPRAREKDLIEMGAKDSKMLSPTTRTDLAGRIRKLATKVSIVEAQPKEIDEVVLHGGRLRKLNFLEAKMMADVVSQLRPDVVYVDASDVNEKRFGDTIHQCLSAELRGTRIVSKHHADRVYPIVSAASIIAKVRRDDAVEDLRKVYGDFGSGYITDPRTLEFLRDWRRTHDRYPSFVRTSWKTIKEIERQIGQSELG